MATIHLDVEAARALQKRLVKLQGSILRDIQKPNITVADIFQPDWRSTSADEFFALYNESSGRIWKWPRKLGEIARELEIEINQWESLADHLAN